ncbi:hypothetical protein BP5796_13170 [Coleophoma crateriformis]|uniref:F-box domain-containing protein n=1 Tax=Coleophoma crateriformis TaxID=565419 RepID=A0A3D8Q3E5_9HELO|nr:hypothetical protein BP5796_13170 [Coleophoma crateriformis]
MARNETDNGVMTSPLVDENLSVDASRPAPGRRVHDTLDSIKGLIHLNDEEPLVDLTAAIPLRSRRTERLQKKKMKKTICSNVRSFLDLSSELLNDILSFLEPSDIFALIRINSSMRHYIQLNEQRITEAIIRLRYPVLAKCFPLPVLFDKVDKDFHPALLSPRHQQRLLIHKRPYQHIKQANPQNTCSCMSCVMAWNNLNLVIDLAHWQNHLESRHPITVIPRGVQPRWNLELIEANASVANKAIRCPLWYARILQKHLDTSIRTIVRHSAVRRKKGLPETDVPALKRLFHLSADDISTSSDSFLKRSGPPSFEFPYHRDKYYTLESYLPNRRWDEGQWVYYGDLHKTDISWAKRIADMETGETNQTNPESSSRGPS